MANVNAPATYEVPEATATLVLEEPPFAGAEIETRLTVSPTVYFGVKHWLDQFGSEHTADENMAAAGELASLFHEYGLVSWKLTRAGKPIPQTREGVQSLDLRLIYQISITWLNSIGSVPIPQSATPPSGQGRRGKGQKMPTTSTNGRSNAATSRPKSRARTQGSSSASGAAVAPV